MTSSARKSERSRRLDDLERKQKTQAVLIAVQFAANHKVEFDVSDALAVVLVLMTESLAGLDRLEALHD